MKEGDKLTERIIGCCFRVHQDLGPGFNEKIYNNALRMLFEREGIQYQTEKQFDGIYSKKKIGTFRADLVVEGEVIVELKSLTGNIPVLCQSQLLAYLRASGLHTALLINFDNKSCQVKRVVL